MIARVVRLASAEAGLPVGAVVAAALLAMACSRPAPPGVRIVEPAEGAVLAGPSVRVLLEATGIEIAPASEQRAGTAHHHLFLDTDLTAPGDTIPAGVTGIIHLGRGQSEFTFEGVAPGQHRVIAVLADPWHIPTSRPRLTRCASRCRRPEGGRGARAGG